jgi:hypothetical protein
MHPAIEYEITKAQLAERRRHAEQAAIARAARRARPAPAPPPAHPAAGLARRVLSLLAARSRAVQGPPQPLPACPPPAPCASCA